MKNFFLFFVYIVLISVSSFSATKEKCQQTLESSKTEIPLNSNLISKLVSSVPYQNLIRLARSTQKIGSFKLLVTQLKRYKTIQIKSKLVKTLFLLTLLYPSNAISQQSLFNVPSIEPTKEAKIFFQEQVNVLPSEGVSNTTIDYGLGNGWSAGLSLYNVKAYSNNGAQPIPDLMFNIEKVVDITPRWHIGMGAQTGVNPTEVNQVNALKNFSYFQNVYIAPNEAGKYYLGYYFANDGFSERGNNNGFMLGMEIPIIKHHLNLMGDYLSGENASSVGVLGLVWYAPSNLQISIGVQIPSPNSQNDFGVVFELTKPTL